MSDNRIQIEELRKDFLISEIEKYEKKYIDISKSKSIYKDYDLNTIYNYLIELREELRFVSNTISGIQFNEIFENPNPKAIIDALEKKYNNSKLYEAYYKKCDKPKKVKGHPKKEKNTRNIQDNIDKH